MTAMPEHWKSYFRALNPSTINGCGEGAWRSRRGPQAILEGNHDNPESGSHQRGLKFQNFFGQNALRPLPSPSHLKKGNNSPLLIKSVTLFRPAGYFNFCRNPCKRGEKGKKRMWKSEIAYSTQLSCHLLLHPGCLLLKYVSQCFV